MKTVLLLLYCNLTGQKVTATSMTHHTSLIKFNFIMQNDSKATLLPQEFRKNIPIHGLLINAACFENQNIYTTCKVLHST